MKKLTTTVSNHRRAGSDSVEVSGVFSPNYVSSAWLVILMNFLFSYIDQITMNVSMFVRFINTLYTVQLTRTIC